ncbi:hypothetical protein TVAG_416590 [Trichomonas vaginalis G3]|uniref:Spindle assembly abnormal protein 6 N-terminal domain-containing protein n=1 Tax=Trichomonas vaginalis (strain ATCC PRA-98 / G3) TaxID=412133 RepID=A2EQQ1_TRIV3|nr:assembly abnormal protein 6-related family [Trichomonas vaginalis G3]EAY05016.1 hypothetical protein TVAG_416590 [Trichomonas vaginalis G3]KAI5502942.1 assembly abnormal protein 6-related family [Trichomonas vaginalis G3]|eukprot:XP_001317239.1 hypothetical protein [Trichomonas vaginalis G3]
MEDPLQDPSLKPGEKLIYSKEINFKFHNKAENEIQLRPTIIKIFTFRDDDDKLETIRFEISQQENVFFLYSVEYDEESFETLKNKESLKISFEDFPTIMIEILNKAALEKDEYNVEFEIPTNDLLQLNIVMPLKFKDVPIFSLDFQEEDDALIEKQVQYRYNVVQYELRKTRIEISNFIDTLGLSKPSGKGKGLRK